MISVVAVLTAKPGQREAVLAAFRANVPAVLAEAGCLSYVPVIDVPEAGRAQANLGADTFMVIESWASLEALQAHGRAPHMVTYGEATKDMMASRAIHILQPA